MNTPVSYEIAKLLNEKGFDEKCEHWAYLDNNCMAMVYDSKTCVKVPTISEVVMWLYEKHGIWIAVTLEVGYKTTFCYHVMGEDISSAYKAYFKSPTEAYEAAIEYALKNLI